FAGHTRDFGGERVKLIDHRIHGVFELENLAFDVHADLARQVAAGHGRGHFGDVAHLRGQVAAHGVDGVGQVLPGAGGPGDFRLTAQTAVRADFAGHARHFRGERAELLDHRVHGLFELQDFAANIDGDLLGEVAVSNSDGHFGDVADLSREIAGHRVDIVG